MLLPAWEQPPFCVHLGTSSPCRSVTPLAQLETLGPILLSRPSRCLHWDLHPRSREWDLAPPLHYLGTVNNSWPGVFRGSLSASEELSAPKDLVLMPRLPSWGMFFLLALKLPEFAASSTGKGCGDSVQVSGCYPKHFNVFPPGLRGLCVGLLVYLF